MLPVLTTDPLNRTVLPAVTGPGGQLSVMLRPGVVATGQLTEVTATLPRQTFWPRAVTETEQVSNGTV